MRVRHRGIAGGSPDKMTRSSSSNSGAIGRHISTLKEEQEEDSGLNSSMMSQASSSSSMQGAGAGAPAAADNFGTDLHPSVAKYFRDVAEAIRTHPDVVEQVGGIVHFVIGPELSFVVDLKNDGGSVRRVRVIAVDIIQHLCDCVML